MKKAIILIGAPGSGKSTQAKFIVSEKKYKHYIQSSLIKKEAKKDESLLKIIGKGNLISNKRCVEIFENEFNFEKKVLLDGYPRTSYQNKHLKSFLEKNGYEYVVLYVEVFEKDVEKRILKRAKIEKREDDKIEIFRKRFKIFEEKTLKHLEKDFSDKIIKVDGSKTIENIKKQIFLKLEKANF